MMTLQVPAIDVSLKLPETRKAWGIFLSNHAPKHRAIAFCNEQSQRLAILITCRALQEMFPSPRQAEYPYQECWDWVRGCGVFFSALQDNKELLSQIRELLPEGYAYFVFPWRHNEESPKSFHGLLMRPATFDVLNGNTKREHSLVS